MCHFAHCRVQPSIQYYQSINAVGCGCYPIASNWIVNSVIKILVGTVFHMDKFLRLVTKVDVDWQQYVYTYAVHVSILIVRIVVF